MKKYRVLEGSNKKFIGKVFAFDGDGGLCFYGDGAGYSRYKNCYFQLTDKIYSEVNVRESEGRVRFQAHNDITGKFIYCICEEIKEVEVHLHSYDALVDTGKGVKSYQVKALNELDARRDVAEQFKVFIGLATFKNLIRSNSLKFMIWRTCECKGADTSIEDNRKKFLANDRQPVATALTTETKVTRANSQLIIVTSEEIADGSIAGSTLDKWMPANWYVSNYDEALFLIGKALNETNFVCISLSPATYAGLIRSDKHGFLDLPSIQQKIFRL